MTAPFTPETRERLEQWLDAVAGTWQPLEADLRAALAHIAALEARVAELSKWSPALEELHLLGHRLGWLPGDNVFRCAVETIERLTAELDGAVWQSIETAPTVEMAVIVYCKNAKWTDWNGQPVTFGQVRDYAERCELAFYSDGKWWQAGTGHDLFEPEQDEDWFPTHWMALPAAPAPAEGGDA